MKRNLSKFIFWFGVVSFFLVYPIWLQMVDPKTVIAGVIQAVIPQVVPTANKRGTATVFQLAANTSAASAGATFCDDGSGNVTTSGCNSGGGTVNGGTAGQFGYYASTGSTISGASGMTTHGVVLYEGTSAPASTAAGSSGQCLISNGASLDPTYQACPTGTSSFTIIDTKTASSSATLDFTSDISATYTVYQFELEQIVTSATGIQVGIIVSTNNGSTWDSTSGHYADSQLFINDAGVGAGGANTDTAANFLRNNQTSNANSISGTIKLYNPASTALNKTFEGLLGGYDASNQSACNWIFHGVYTQNTTSVNAVRFLPASGTFTSGTIRLYGLGH